MAEAARDTFDEGPGMRRLDLAGMPAEDFEELVQRVVRVAHPKAVHTGNPDNGADTLLPKRGDEPPRLFWRLS